MVKLYGYKKCGTCRKAEKALADAGLDYQFIDITEQPPSGNALKKIAAQAGVDMKKMFNTSGVQYREQKVKDQLPLMSEKAMLDLLASNGRLIKRPLVTDGERSTVGFDAAAFGSVWRG